MSLALYIAILSISNAFAGRGAVAYDRIIGRLIIPALMTLLYAQAWIPALMVLIGSALWFPWGYSFDEMTGQYSATKYHKFIQTIGSSVFPNDGNASTNKKRGILMKGIRGMYDVTPILLGAWYLWPLTFLMGFTYWLCGAIVTGKNNVVTAEFVWGAIRGLLIGLSL